MNASFAAGDQARATVVIVNFNGGAHVLRCLESLAAQTMLPERIVLVDNGSTDGSLAACREFVASRPELAERTTIDATSENLGFAAGSNRGIAAADTELVAAAIPTPFRNRAGSRRSSPPPPPTPSAPRSARGKCSPAGRGCSTASVTAGTQAAWRGGMATAGRYGRPTSRPGRSSPPAPPRRFIGDRP